ncbi:MAG: NAD(P) transhydrogenase subunit alpha [Firmicutes bacterium]|jgi:NAD(P) transhydrogenase subunit alpha|nr:NAD(P) transhydrogenase subunit alpha [Bacillota bacterium]
MSIPILFALFAVASIVGYKVISDVPSLLHTPLMSGTNALSGVTVLGALTVAALAKVTGYRLLGAVAVILAMINVVGGFLVTHRMLRMFKKGTESEGRENVMG